MKALVLAGGLGNRMRPYTSIIPKPLMPLNNEPILEHILQNFRNQDILDITISLGYQSYLIEAYLQGKGYRVNFVKEESPLGTAGPVGLMEFEKALLVMNGDIVTNLDFRKVLDFHFKNNAALTVVTKKIYQKLSVGTLIYDSSNSVLRIDERPTSEYDINCGIYVLNPCVLKHIPKGVKLDFPDLIYNLLTFKEVVKAYSLGSGEEWTAIEDINTLAQFQNEKN